jgi:hypothetical protein
MLVHHPDGMASQIYTSHPAVDPEMKDTESEKNQKARASCPKQDDRALFQSIRLRGLLARALPVAAAQQNADAQQRRAH